jgi:hypothetical protein
VATGNVDRSTSKDLADEQSWTPWLGLVLLAGVLLSGVALHPVFGEFVANPARYAAVFVFGLLVGTTELVSRYRDKPVAPLGTWPGLIYIGVNAVASVCALWILTTKGVAFDFGGALPPALGQVLLAGFGTMVLFRSALFTIRVGDTDVAIGPAAVLQIILNAADRACDRLRAGPRSARVYGIMRGVSFERARQTLPLHCFGLMQNVSTAEQTQLLQTIDALGTKQMTEEVKSYNLGLLMMNVVGEDVLGKAVAVLGPLILGPASDEPPILAQASSLSPGDVKALVALCTALDPLARTDLSPADISANIQSTINGIDDVSVQNVIALMQLRHRFGPTTIARALALLASTRRPVGTPVTGTLTAADLVAPAPPPETRTADPPTG